MKVYYCLVQYVDPVRSGVYRIVLVKEMDLEDIYNNTSICQQTYAEYNAWMMNRPGHTTQIIAKNADDTFIQKEAKHDS